MANYNNNNYSNTNTMRSSTRTSSQTSIYDYPEHLNPFYEDENHKRLRFWNLGKKSQTMGRRSSFSLSGIRDMWAFKSFTLKKKSSTLGINKTSESPPPLRREQFEPNYNTIGSGYRSTVSTAAGLNNNFLRNTGGRASYQDINRNKMDADIGFNRNDRYRSTIQNVNGTPNNRYSPETENRYVYRGSVTPTPRSKYLVNRGMTPGSSQISVVSTNPFDDEEDNGIVNSQTTTTTVSNGVPLKKPIKVPRKKRRAPPPPTNVPRLQTTPITVHTTELRIEEEPSPPKIDEEAEIRNLTAQIETFVHRSSLDEIVVPRNPEPKPTEVKIIEASASFPNHTSEDVVQKDIEQPLPQQTVKVKNDASTSTSTTTSTTTTETIRPPVRRHKPVRDDSPISTQVEEILEQAVKKVSSQNDLKIVESSGSESDVATLRHNDNNNSNIEFDNVNLNSNENIDKNYRKVLSETKTSTPQTREGSIERNDAQSTEVVHSVPTGRRRSVRDIIESINRSQSLLKIGHEPEYKFTNNGNNHADTYFRVSANETTNQKIQNTAKPPQTPLEELNNSEAQLKAMIEELEKGNAKDIKQDYNRNSYYDNLPDLMEKFDELHNKNSILFEKCPLRSSGKRKDGDDGLGVNPVPKPRRSMNLSDFSNNNGNHSHSSSPKK